MIEKIMYSARENLGQLAFQSLLEKIIKNMNNQAINFLNKNNW